LNEADKKDAAELSDNELENAVGGKKGKDKPYGNYPHHRFSDAYGWCTQAGISQSDFDRFIRGENNCRYQHNTRGYEYHYCVYCQSYHEERA
jgi:hypothetical protein